MALENGIPSHNTFSWLFAELDPAGLQKALLRLAQDWADRLGGGDRQGAPAVVRGRLGAVADAPPAGVRGAA